MKSYADIRGEICDGDVFAVKNRGLFSIAVRVLTGESVNHVAVAVWIGDGLWVAEMREGRGYRLVRASGWLQENQGKLVFWVEAPPVVRGNDSMLRIVVETKAENPGYSNRTLVKVWSSQLVNRMKKGAMVCSMPIRLTQGSAIGCNTEGGAQPTSQDACCQHG